MYLELDRLSKQFDGKYAVHDLSLGLEEGGLLCILGSSGCGKTTTLNMIGGFLKPDGGRVLLDGQDITALPPERRPVSTVFQSYGLFPHMSVLQNVTYGLKFRGYSRAEAYSREIGYPIFVGVEFFSLWGDITAWGIDGIPDQRVGTQDFIDLVREKDGFCVSCHPFRSNNRGLREHLRDVHGLDGVEVLNGSTPLEENRTALRFCRELGLKAIGASDAHVPEQVGKYVTWLPETVTTLPDFVTALHTLETRPAIWTGSGYDVVTGF